MSEEEKELKNAMEELESIVDGAIPPELSKEEAKALLNLIEKNKKEIQELKWKESEQKNLLKHKTNKIDKQQKEIKKLEEQKRGLLVETYKNNDEKDKEIEEKFISKDKITEKIKEYQKHIDNINNKAPKRKDGKPNNIFNHANREFYKSKVEVLEQLLEENNNV